MRTLNTSLQSDFGSGMIIRSGAGLYDVRQGVGKGGFIID
jgi:hypothetical protein